MNLNHYFIGLLLAVFLCAVAYAQTEFVVACKDGICQMRESDLDKLQKIIDAMYARLVELQKGTCT